MDNQKLLELKELIEKLVNQTKSSRFLIAIAGPIAVGKSTFANQIKKQLEDNYPTQVVASDSFLFSNRELEAKGIFDKKGWPESFDVEKLQAFLVDVKEGNNPGCNNYSQMLSDIDYQNKTTIEQNTKIVILEGINVLQKQFLPMIDLKIYLDANSQDLMEWYLTRTLNNVDLAKDHPESWFHQFSAMPTGQVEQIALEVWQEVNQTNIDKYIAPTKTAAEVVINFKNDHEISEMTFKKGL